MKSPLMLDDAAASDALRAIDVRAELAAMFASLDAGNAVQPPQMLTLLPAGKGDFITYLGALADRGVFGAKLSPYLPGEAGALVTAWTLLMSMETGAPLMLCDAKRLTTERTAATTALAVDLLAPRSARTLSIVGTGAVGLAHLRHAASVRPWTSVTLSSPQAATKSDLPIALDSGCPIRIEADAARAVAEADVVLLCTSSATPMVDVGATRPGALITSISTNVADAHEIDPAALPEMDVYCDYMPTAPLSAGEMKLAVAQGVWSTEALRGDLPTLITGKALPPADGKRIFFRSIGLGLEDIALAHAVWRTVTSEVRA